MATQPYAQRAETSTTQGSKLIQILLYGGFFTLVVVATILWILSAIGKIPTLWAAIFSALSGMLSIVGSFFPFTSNKTPPPQSPTTQLLIHPYSPFINQAFIYQNVKVIQDIYAKLAQADVNAIVLTGSPGIGKSTLAFQVYQYAEEQRVAGKGPFTEPAIWYRVDGSFTIAHLSDSILGRLGSPIPNFQYLPPQNQAAALVHALEADGQPRLIFLDQFESLLDRGKAHGSNSRPGVDEFLDALNRQAFEKSGSRLVLTSTSMPWEASEGALIHIKEYHVGGLGNTQSLEFLKVRGLPVDQEALKREDTQALELKRVVGHFNGNALALTLLASILEQSNAKLEDLIHDPRYAQLLTSNNAYQLLNYIYTQQLNSDQRRLLVAFSVFRERVPLTAAQAILEPNTVPESTLLDLVDQSLIIPTGANYYQLHPVVAHFARDQFDTTSEQDNYRARQEAHAKAAKYYLKQANEEYPSVEQRGSSGKLHLLVEAIWHYCRAGKLEEAYELMEQQDIYSRLSRQGASAILLELYELLLPLDRWHPKRLQAAYIYNNLGEVYLALENKEEAYKHFKQALPLFKGEKDRAGAGRVLHNIGLISSLEGQEIQFWGYLEQSWDSYGLSGQKFSQEEIVRKYHQQAVEADEYLTQALSYLEQALALRRDAGDRVGTGKTLHIMGRTYSALEDKEQALICYEEALRIAREVGDQLEESQVLYSLGRLYNVLGKKQRVKASEYLSQALRIQEEIGDWLGEAATWNSLGRTYDDMGQEQDAWRCYLKALRIEREVGDRRGTAITLHNIGLLYLEQGPHEQMLAFLMLSKAIFEEMRNPHRGRKDRSMAAVDGKVEAVLKTISPEVAHIVESALQDGLPREESVKTSAYLSFSLPSESKAWQGEDAKDGDGDDENESEDVEENDEDQRQEEDEAKWEDEGAINVSMDE